MKKFFLIITIMFSLIFSFEINNINNDFSINTIYASEKTTSNKSEKTNHQSKEKELSNKQKENIKKYISNIAILGVVVFVIYSTIEEL